MRFLKWFTIFGMLAIGLGMLAVVGAYVYIEPILPTTQQITEIQLKQPIRVYTADRLLIGEYGNEKRELIEYEDIPLRLEQALLAAEDENFYDHIGIEWRGLTRAVYHLVTTGQRGVGGSTITMQLARNLFLNNDKTYVRKVAELFLSIRLEQTFTKQEILTLYANRVFLGHRSYGFKAAARTYYNKDLDQLDIAETAMLVGMLKGPSVLNPINNPQRGTDRRNYVLRRMVDEGMITPEVGAAEQAKLVTSRLFYVEPDIDAEFVGEMARQRVESLVGDKWHSVGYRVYTTIESSRQIAAQTAVRNNIIAYEKRHGYTGPVSSLPSTSPYIIDSLKELSYTSIQAGVVTRVDSNSAEVLTADGQNVTLTLKDVEWARERITEDKVGKAIRSVDQVLSVDDVIMMNGSEFIPMPKTQSAMVDIDPRTGNVRAIVGGFDFKQSQFNRAVQIKRQPGSSLKPFLYSAAFQIGYSPETVLMDAPISWKNGKKMWKPMNYGGKYYGPTPLTEALVHSRNVIAVRLLREVGIEYVTDHMIKFGFNETQLPRDFSLALGNAAVSPLDMATAYTAFANGGYRVPARFITRIEDSSGNVVYQAPVVKMCDDCSPTTESPLEMANERPSNYVDAPRIISRDNVNTVRYLMEQVVQRGTAAKAGRILGDSGFGGKTGTTNDQMDAWFAGLSDNTVVVVWVGNDKLSPLGKKETGGAAALPAWIDYVTSTEKIVPKEPVYLEVKEVDEVYQPVEITRTLPRTAPRVVPKPRNVQREVLESLF